MLGGAPCSGRATYVIELLVSAELGGGQGGGEYRGPEVCGCRSDVGFANGGGDTAGDAVGRDYAVRRDYRCGGECEGEGREEQCCVVHFG